MSLTKRQQAAMYRQAAKVLEEDGWTHGELHLHRETKRTLFVYGKLKDALNAIGSGAQSLRECKHCAVGAINAAAVEMGLTDEVGYCIPQRNALAERQVLDQIGAFGLNPGLRNSLQRLLENDDFSAGDFTVSFNDQEAREVGADLAVKMVAGFLRKVARHLEHGGG